MSFPVSGVECPVWLPFAVAFAVAAATTPAGLSGAFLLLPFQMSVLGFTSPGVTPTNLVYNIVAIPGGVVEYVREHRMAWPLAWSVAAGTLPGVILGAVIRVRYLPDPRAMKLFVGLVLLYIGVRLLWEARRRGITHAPALRAQFPHGAELRFMRISAAEVEYEFADRRFSFRPATLFTLALIVGVVGGIYGVGGGAIIAPFVVGILGLPAYTIAGATLLGTFLTSIVGVATFELLGRMSVAGGTSVQPDYVLGLLFGAGGLFGSYLGARWQKYLPEQWIKRFLGVVATGLASAYVWQFFQ